MLNVVVDFKIWGHLWADHKIQILTVTTWLWFFVRLLMAMCNISVIVAHIPGAHNNTADVLSRWTYTEL